VGRRQPDALVDGRVTEFKSLSRGASDATVKNQLRTAKGQAPNVVQTHVAAAVFPRRPSV